MDNTFAANNGLVFALYIEGQYCFFEQIVFSQGVGMVPEMEVQIPATSYIKRIPDKSAAHLLFMDVNEPVPRPYVWFEGEVHNKDFQKTATGSRSFIIRIAHITNILDKIKFTFLRPDEYMEEVISGEDETQVLVANVSGTIFEQFQPQTLMQLSSEDERYAVSNQKSPAKFDIHDYVRLSLVQLGIVARNSLVSEQYNIKALDKYNFIPEKFDPNVLPTDRFYHPTTGTGENTHPKGSRLQWADLLNAIMQYYYASMIAREGGQMTYMEMVTHLLQIFAHEFMINSAPRKFNQTLQVKPSTVFAPVPTCNIIYPIHQTAYRYNEPYDQKPTRMLQITHSPVLSKEQERGFRRFLRQFAPKELSDLFKLYEKTLDENKLSGNVPGETVMEAIKKTLRDQLYPNDKEKKFSLVTEEERRRGIIESRNEIPGYLTSAMEIALTDPKDFNKAQNISGVTFQYDPRYNPQTRFYQSEITNLTDDMENALKYKYFDPILRTLEKSNVNKSDLASNVLGFVPKRITIVSTRDFALPIRINLADKTTTNYENYKAHYIIDSTGIHLNPAYGRYYGLFKEAEGALPYAFYLDANLATAVDSTGKPVKIVSAAYTKGNNSVAFKDADVTKVSGFSSYKAKLADTVPALGSPNFLKEAKAWVAGTNHNVIIAVDYNNLEDASTKIKDNVGKVCALIALLSFSDIDSFPITNMRYYGIDDKSQIDDGTLDGVIASFKTSLAKYQNDFNADSNIKKAREDSQKSINKYSAIVGLTDAQPVGSTNQGTPAVNINTGEGNNEKQKANDVKEPKIVDNKSTANIVNLTKTDLLVSKNTLNNSMSALSEKFTPPIDTFATPKVGVMQVNSLNNSIKDTAQSLTKIKDATGKAASKLSADQWQATLTAIALKSQTIAEADTKIKQIKSTGKQIMETANKLSKEADAAAQKMAQIHETAAQTLKTTLDAKINSIGADSKKQIDAQVEKVNKLKAQLAKVTEQAAKIASDPYGQLINQISSAQASLVEQNKAQQDLVARLRLQVAETLFVKPDPTKSVKSTLPSEQKFDREDVVVFYAQPLVDYFFLYNRFLSSTVDVSMVANPFITHGYNALILDNASADEQIHLLGFVSMVVQIIAPSSLNTRVRMDIVRRGDDLETIDINVPGESLTKTDILAGAGLAQTFAQQVDKFKVDDIIGDTIPETDSAGKLKVDPSDGTIYRQKYFKQLEKVPFFGGEFSTELLQDGTNRSICDETFEELLGPGVKMARALDIEANQFGIADLKTAYRQTRRIFQTCRVNPPTSKSQQGRFQTDLQSTYDQYYFEAPSVVSYVFPGDKNLFPEEISCPWINSSKENRTKELIRLHTIQCRKGIPQVGISEQILGS